MKIATFVNENDEVTSLRGPGRFCVFEQILGEWKNTTTMSLDLSDATTIAEARLRLKDAVVPFKECQAFLSAEIHGLWNLLLQESGLSTWKSEGPLFVQLDNVMASVAQVENVGESSPTKECQKSFCNQQCKPTHSPTHTEGLVDVGQFFIEDAREKGCFKIDLASLLTQRPEFTSREVLIPFLESGAFIRLEIRCSHIPRWFDKKIEREGLTARIESSEDDAHSGMLLVFVESNTLRENR